MDYSWKEHDRILDKALLKKMYEGESVENEKSPCCNESIKFTENSGIYVMPGIYCSKCKKLL